MPPTSSECVLILEPAGTPAGALEAFLKAAQVAAQYYGVAADVEAPPGLFTQESVQGLRETGVALEKALPTHPSHYQPRVAGGRFTRLHPGNYNPRDAAGRFRQRLDASERQAALDEAGQYVTQFGDRLQDHLADYQQRGLPGPDFLARCERDIRLFYAEVYRRGKQTVGDPAVKLTPQDKAALNRLVKDELDYLIQFEAAMAAGATSPQWPPQKRMALYGRAAWEAYWMGWVLGDQRTARDLKWVYGNTFEHCGFAEGGKALGCSDFVTKGWTPVRQFVTDILAAGFTPRSGQLECHGILCDCRIEERLGGVVQPPVLYPAGH